MNLRIKELAIEARLITVDGITRYALDYEFEKRFAELLVQECCDVLQNEDIIHSKYGYNQGFLHEKIKNHFGVEE